MTGLVDRLEAAGHVRRDRDPQDRRRVLVVPGAEAGRPDLSGIFADLAAAMGGSPTTTTSTRRGPSGTG